MSFVTSIRKIRGLIFQILFNLQILYVYSEIKSKAAYKRIVEEKSRKARRLLLASVKEKPEVPMPTVSPEK